ncbi:tol-pal system protein YbgF [Geobacter sp. SVR]|uniref:tol-pal system protein YbgF n=1 Tax=Geobacter sp. SVR TaxID=2495594 RepID=UPI00143F0336|nr:tol-pal system protein YbgF [Geobacter sp. SVR]BCS52401.1 lipoprotein [Geobacter sp. SVR]GCF87366.1 lipoprotein [Geobacter sp. SVR]
MRITVRVAALSLVLGALSGCASQGALDAVRNDMDAVKTRLFSVEKDLGGVRDESKTGLGSIEKTFKSDVAAVRRIAADIQATIDGTKGDIQALSGKVDDATQALKKPTEEFSRYREDVDKRIIQLEDRTLKLQKTLDDIAKRLAEQPTSKEAATSPDALYLKGLDTFKSGDMAGARELFQKFLEQHPQHDLASNANYWIGETYYSEKNYEAAILAFQEVIKGSPNKEKVPAAMLKQAMAFRAINDAKSVRYVLKKLTEMYPKSEETKKAKELLKEI